MFFNLKCEVVVGFGSCKLSKLRTGGVVYKNVIILVLNFCPIEWNCHLFYPGTNMCIYCMVV
jgi:hypothetical protein